MTVGATLSSMQWTLPRNEPGPDGLLLSHTAMIYYITCNLVFLFLLHQKQLKLNSCVLVTYLGDLIFIDYGTIFSRKNYSMISRCLRAAFIKSSNNFSGTPCGNFVKNTPYKLLYFDL